MSWQSKWEPWIGLGLAAFYAVGLAGHALPATRPWMLALTPYVLVVYGLLAFLPIMLERGWRVWVWSLTVFAVTFALEAVGTATGLIFGPYTYGRTLGLPLLRVPLVIAFNWLLVILGAVILSRLLLRRLARWTGAVLAAALAALLAAGFDWVLEPVAIRLDYWTWHGGGIPLQNYAAWFLIALLSGLGFTLPGLRVRTRLPMYYVGVQLAFFAGLRLLLPVAGGGA